jgi:L-rhamnose mutarotase
MEGLQLSAAWNSVEDGKHKHGVTEYAISQTTLEQVFVRFAAEQEEETGMDGAALAASIRQTIPNCMDMLCCKPSQNHEWSVPLDAEGRNRIEVKVQFAYGACLCCKANPGVVTVDGLPVKAVDDQGQQTEEDLLLTGRTNPGCIDSSCCGCTSCCGFSSCFCCRRTNQMFYHSGKVFEVIDYNEIPGTSRARPVFLMVNGKEASSGIERGRYLATVFQEGGKKYCCMIGCPLGILFFLGLVLLANKAYGAGLFLIVVTLVFMVWFCIWCICGNWCGRAGHYRNTPELMVAHESVPVTYDQHVTQAAQPSDVADKSPVHVHQPEDSSLSV